MVTAAAATGAPTENQPGPRPIEPSARAATIVAFDHRFARRVAQADQEPTLEARDLVVGRFHLLGTNRGAFPQVPNHSGEVLQPVFQAFNEWPELSLQQRCAERSNLVELVHSLAGHVQFANERRESILPDGPEALVLLPEALLQLGELHDAAFDAHLGQLKVGSTRHTDTPGHSGDGHLGL